MGEQKKPGDARLFCSLVSPRPQSARSSLRDTVSRAVAVSWWESKPGTPPAALCSRGRASRSPCSGCGFATCPDVGSDGRGTATDTPGPGAAKDWRLSPITGAGVATGSTAGVAGMGVGLVGVMGGVAGVATTAAGVGAAGLPTWTSGTPGPVAEAPGLAVGARCGTGVAAARLAASAAAPGPAGIGGKVGRWKLAAVLATTLAAEVGVGTLILETGWPVSIELWP